MSTTRPPLTDQQHAEIRAEILAALSTAGAYCGACDFEPGETGCTDCVRVRGMYADALTPITDRLREGLERAHVGWRTATRRSDRLRAERDQAREIAHVDANKIDQLSAWAMNTKHSAAAAEVVLILNNGQTPANPPVTAKPVCTCGEGRATLHWSNCQLYTSQLLAGES